jgi:hypothetical protein
MPLFLTLRGATNALPITSAWVGLKPATTNPTWTTANHSQIVSRLHRVAYPGGSILTSRGGLILDSAEAFCCPEDGAMGRRWLSPTNDNYSCWWTTTSIVGRQPAAPSRHPNHSASHPRLTLAVDNEALKTNVASPTDDNASSHLS